jgi:hypothetical protein
MIKSMKLVVSRYPLLEFHANQGEDRIRRTGLKGSLWVKKRYDGFRLQTTSDVASFLDDTIETIFGEPVGEQKGYKYWHINDHGVVEKIIEAFGQQ